MPRPLPATRRLLPAALLTAGLAASVVGSLAIRNDIIGDALGVFHNEADDVTGRVSQRLQTLDLVLRGVAGGFADPSDPQPAEWEIVSLQLQTQLTLPGVQALAFAQAVRPEQLAAHVAKVQSWGFADYTVTPAGQRDLYAPVIFVDPFEGANRQAFGSDSFAEPVRRAAMLRTLATGRPSLSDKVRLVVEEGTNEQAGALIYFPVYRRGPESAGVNPLAVVQGWTVAALRMTDFINGILGGWRHEWASEIELYLFDGAIPEATLQLYSSVPGKVAATGLDEQAHLHRTIDFNGHSWSLLFDFSPALARVDYTLAWLMFGSGLVISFLLYFLAWSLLTVQIRSRKLADELTAEILARQQALADSEYRWKFALEGTGDGLWDWDIPAARIFYSTRWKSMLGYADEDIGSAETEWSTRIHQDDFPAAMQRVQDYIDGRTSTYSSEHRMLCKDGSYKWILDRGMVVARDSNNKPLRMLGTHKDISERKDIEEALESKTAALEEAQRIAKTGSWVHYPQTELAQWSNELFRMFGFDPAKGAPPLTKLITNFAPESWERLATAVEKASSEGIPYELELEFSRADGSHAFMLTRGEPVHAADGSIAMLRGVATDITERVNRDKRIQLLNRLYLTLSDCNDAIVHCRQPDELLQRVCDLITGHGNMTLAWIGLVDPATGDIVPRYCAGEGADYLRGLQISVRPDSPYGLGPTGTATRENRAIWIDNYNSNALTQNWQQRGSTYGWLSSAALPLCRGGQPIGTLTFYSTKPDWFTQDIRALLEELAVNVGFALDKFEAEAAMHQYQATLIESDQRFHSLVEQSLIGAFIIQNHRFKYVNRQLEVLLGYPADNSLLKITPAHIVHEQDRPAMQAKLDQLVAGEILNFDHMFTAVKSDGSTIDVGVTISASTYQQQPAIIGLLQDLSNRQVAEAQIRRYASNLEKVFMQTVGMITNLVEMRDPYTVGHEKHVADLAVAIGREMGLDEKLLEGLQIGGYLHDVGKVSIPSEILSKPGRITAIEYELIKGHPTAGYQILKDVEFPWPVAEIAWQHHERINGSGYPRGLKGNEILLEARIVAVADVVESMYSHRPYRAGLGLDKALAEIERGSGTSYDAAVATACLRLFREHGFSMPQ